MPLASDLMGLGMAPGLASRMGYPPPSPLAGSGTAQVGATQLAGAFSLLNPAAGQTAYAFTAGAPLTKLHYLCNPTATAALVFPPAGGSINGGAANAAFTVPANSLCLATCAVGGSAPQWYVK